MGITQSREVLIGGKRRRQIADGRRQRTQAKYYHHSAAVFRLPSAVSHWRWRIESYFKLMKSGGQRMKHWQQESALSLLKRLLIASMACATVWCLQESTVKESEEFKEILVRLSGKRLKRGRPPTAEILLSGLFVFLRIFDFLVSIDFDLSKIAKLNAAFNKLLPKQKKDGEILL